jgi:O-antigen/teichoic acid export membrane protein
MGFGFNIISIFLIIPSIVILIITFIFSKNKSFKKGIVIIIISLISSSLVLYFIKKINSKLILKKEDFYGEYIRDYEQKFFD